MKKKILNGLVAGLLIVLFSSGLYYYYPEEPLPSSCVIDRMLVLKSKRKLLVFEKGKMLKTYFISLGKNPSGAKEYEGDNRTPEGLYSIVDKNPNSSCYKNLGISYPEKKDRVRAAKRGKSPGGSIKIHGLPDGKGVIGRFHRFSDWTNKYLKFKGGKVVEAELMIRNFARVMYNPVRIQSSA